MKKTAPGAVMFANLDSALLWDRLDEKTALALADSGVALLRRKVGEAGGRVVKTIGDEVMATFADAADAAAAAVAMQKGMALEALAWPGGSRLRIGFTWGPIVEEDGDLFGDTVSFAARACTVRSSTGIVVHGDGLQRLAQQERGAARLVHSHRHKGSGRQSDYYELPWR